MPNFVKKGEPMQASWANDVVRGIRSNTRTGRKLTNIIVNSSAECIIFAEVFDKEVNSENVAHLRGGIVYAGDKNFTVEDIDLTNAIATAGEFVLYFEIPVKVNVDSDGQVLLPNIKTSEWSVEDPLKKATVDSGYPNNTAPTLPDGDATVIVPIGRLFVEDSATNPKPFTFTKAGCGNITINHCAGTVSHFRS